MPFLVVTDYIKLLQTERAVKLAMLPVILTFLFILTSHNNLPLSVPGKGILIPISLGNSNCFGFIADAAFTSTSIGCVASEELSSLLGRFSLGGSSAASLFPRTRPLHVGTGGAKSAHKHFNYMISTKGQSHKYIKGTTISL